MVNTSSEHDENDMLDIRGRDGRLFAKSSIDKKTLKISQKGITVTLKVVDGRIVQTE